MSSAARHASVSEAALALYQVEDAAQVLVAFGRALGAFGYGGAYTLIMNPGADGRAPVLFSNLDDLAPGTRVELDPRLHEGTSDAPPPAHRLYDAPGPVFTGAAGAFAAHAAFRLHAAGAPYGWLLFHDRPAPEHVDALGDLAGHFADALYRSQLSDERQRRHLIDAAKLSSVSSTGQVLRELELEKVLARLMELAITTVGGEVGCIAVADGADAALTVRTEWGFTGDMLASLRLQDGRALGEVVANERLISLSRTAADFSELAPASVLEMMSSLLLMPLATGRRFRGCIVVANAGALEASDLELMGLVCELSATAIDNALLHQDALDREAMRQQLRIAGDIQKGLLPPGPPHVDGVSIAGRNIPCDDSGGDFFDYFVVEGNRVGFVLGDATGHGIGAALIATTARAAFRALIGTRPRASMDLAGILAELNELAERDFADDKFMTLFFGLYDADRRTLDYASAGHDPPMLVYSRERDAFRELESTGLPLGMFAGMPYDRGESVELSPGDVMLVMSDGVNEAPNPAGAQFGKARVLELVRANAGLQAPCIVDNLAQEVFRFTHGAAQNDDITMVCLRVDS